jgi:hypothetical protein
MGLRIRTGQQLTRLYLKPGAGIGCELALDPHPQVRQYAFIELRRHDYEW